MAASMKMTVFCNVAPCSFIEIHGHFRGVYCCLNTLMMEAVSTSETSVNFYETTWPDIPEDSLLHNNNCVWMWNNGEIMVGKTNEVLENKPAPELPFPLQIPHGLPKD
jgi:hypothetical protein